MNEKEYLKRIGFVGELNPSLELLAQLQKQHLLTVPFENLDIHQNVSIELDIDKLYNKVVINKRGGFCYELNGLFYELLRSIGFDVKMISARVFNSEKQGFGPEFDHMAIIAEIDGVKYLTDVGFGEFTFQPLKIELDQVQADDRGSFKLEKYDEHYFKISKLNDNQWVPEYIFSETTRSLDDYKKMCQYHQTSPDSHFTQKRVCSLPTEGGRLTVSGDTLKIKNGESTEELDIKNVSEFMEYLREYFGLQL